MQNINAKKKKSFAQKQDTLIKSYRGNAGRDTGILKSIGC